MYFITGAVGFLACIIFMVILIIFAIRGKKCVVPMTAFGLSILLFLGSGFLFSRTAPDFGGLEFLEFLLRDTSVPPDLTGEWREAGSGDSYHGIYISGDVIEVYWVTEGGNSRSLYWAGTFETPPNGKEPYTWVSQNDTRRTSAAQLASGEATKEFTYQNGKLSYPASILGVNSTIRVVKESWGYFGPPVVEEEAE
jgi:hypothetical protein